MHISSTATIVLIRQNDTRSACSPRSCCWCLPLADSLVSPLRRWRWWIP